LQHKSDSAQKEEDYMCFNLQPGSMFGCISSEQVTIEIISKHKWL